MVIKTKPPGRWWYARGCLLREPHGTILGGWVERAPGPRGVADVVMTSLRGFCLFPCLSNSVSSSLLLGSMKRKGARRTRACNAIMACSRAFGLLLARKSSVACGRRGRSAVWFRQKAERWSAEASKAADPAGFLPHAVSCRPNTRASCAAACPRWCPDVVLPFASLIRGRLLLLLLGVSCSASDAYAHVSHSTTVLNCTPCSRRS